MAVDEYSPVTTFTDWYVDYDPTGDRGALRFRSLAPRAEHVVRGFRKYKTEMDARVANYQKYERLAACEVLKEKPDLPNISSGETAGIIRRTAWNLVQNAPNLEVISIFDDDEVNGIVARHVLLTKVVGSDLYSNDMQQNLFASTKTALTLGFACVVPVLQHDPQRDWHMKYDTIHYRDVFPEPGAKDVRDATCVYVRRYLTRGEVAQIIANNIPGWDLNAMRALIRQAPRARDLESGSYEDKRHRGSTPEGYEIITKYTSSGDPFLTFCPYSKMLLRIEKNKHPRRQHPVFFLVLEKDEHQPLGKSQVDLLVGRQDFQDLMLNGSMKLYYRNINPSIIGYGAPNAVVNLSPGTYTPISNPQARLEPFEVNTGTLMQFGQISRENYAAMVNLFGSGDQQMAAASNSGSSATPQGVEAQQQMVDSATNNFQKAIENFVSHYCSYALTVFFAELKSLTKFKPTGDTRLKLLEAGLEAPVSPDGEMDFDFSKMTQEYFVRCIPGSLVELEDEKHLRILNQLFIPLTQAMPALVQAQEPEMLKQAVRAMSYIIGKQIELSGSSSSTVLRDIWVGKSIGEQGDRDNRIRSIEDSINGIGASSELQMQLTADAIQQLRENQAQMAQNMQLLLEKLGVTSNGSTEGSQQPAAMPPQDVAPVPELA